MLYFDAGLNDLINCNMIFRAIDAQSLIGTVGGYIGLFLGYSLLEMPKTILVILNKLKKRIGFQFREQIRAVTIE